MDKKIYDSQEYGKEAIWGAKINGVNITTLIKKNAISSDTMKEEDFMALYTEIMNSSTDDKNMLALEIQLAMSKPMLIRDLLINQFNLSVKEMAMEKKGYYRKDMIDRKFKFLATICILNEKGFDLNSLKFYVENKETSFIELVGLFQSLCGKYSPIKSMNESPFWHKDKSNNDCYFENFKDPELVANYLLKKEYAKNPDVFLREWAASLSEEQRDSFDKYMTKKYRISIKGFGKELNEYVDVKTNQIINNGEDINQHDKPTQKCFSVNSRYKYPL